METIKTYKTQLKRFSLKSENSEYKKVKISTIKDAVDYIKQFYSDDIEVYESFFILLLNRANNTIGYAKISQGGITGTVVDNMIIAKYAVDSLASGVILAHNHPSGNNKPSDQDKQVTRQVTEALKLFNCTVLDHIILTSESYFSFQENGLI